MSDTPLPLSVWLVQPGEPLPFQGDNPRLLRTGLLAEELCRRGHNVTWWASNFSHTTKRHYFETGTEVSARPGLSIVCLNGRAYSRNVSLARLLNHWDLRRAFAKAIAKRPLPDIIVASLPNPDLAEVAAVFGRNVDRPVIVDIRDLWPEAWTFLVPPLLRPLAKLALAPIERQTRQALRLSTGIIGVSERVLDWGLAKAGRMRRTSDRVFPSAYESRSPSASTTASAFEHWRSLGLSFDSSSTTACYVGHLSRRAAQDLVEVVEVFRDLPAPLDGWRLVIAGNGDLERDLRQAAQGSSRIIFPGWINAPQIWTLMRLSAIGILPYRNDPDLQSGHPNKFGEYLSAGLPIVSSLKGAVGQTIIDADCGRTYTTKAELSAVLAELSSAPWTLAELRKNAKSAFVAGFDANIIYTKYADFVEEIALSFRVRNTTIPCNLGQ